MPEGKPFLELQWLPTQVGQLSVTFTNALSSHHRNHGDDLFLLFLLQGLQGGGPWSRKGQEEVLERARSILTKVQVSWEQDATETLPRAQKAQVMRKAEVMSWQSGGPEQRLSAGMNSVLGA